MRFRIPFVPSFVAWLLAAGLVSVGPVSDAAWAGKKSVKKQRSYVLESRRPSRAPRIYLPIGPSYTYYDYPYYYSRGHYPTHIVRYVYYNPNGYFDRNYYRRSLRRHRARR
jgi:hypothetical protein